MDRSADFFLRGEVARGVSFGGGAKVTSGHSAETRLEPGLLEHQHVVLPEGDCSGKAGNASCAGQARNAVPVSRPASRAANKASNTDDAPPTTTTLSFSAADGISLALCLSRL